MSLKLYACCLCFPLRIGLLVWGYFGLAINYISIVHTSCRIYDIFGWQREIRSWHLHVLVVNGGALMIHFIFYIVLIAGLHKKSCTLLEIFYGFSVIVMIIWATIKALYIPINAYKLYPSYKFDVWWVVLLHVILAAVVLLLQFYLVVSVRSMISTLEDEKSVLHL